MADEGADSDLWWIGAALYVTGSVFINLGSNMIRRSHSEFQKQKKREADKVDNNTSTSDLDLGLSSMPSHENLLSAEEQEREREADGISKFRYPRKDEVEIHTRMERYIAKFGTLPYRWWGGGFSLFLMGNVFNFIAFMFAAQSLLVALGSVQFLANIGFAKWINGERVTKTVITSCTVIGGGIILVVSFGPKSSTNYSPEELQALLLKWPFLLFIIIESLTIIVLQAISLYLTLSYIPRVGINSIPRWVHTTFIPISYVVVSVLVGTQSILLGKIMSGLVLLFFVKHEFSALAHPFPYCACAAWLLATVFWLHRMNTALKLYDAMFIIPTMQGLWLLFGALEGGVFFQELFVLSLGSILLYTLGLAIVIIGVFLLAPKGRTLQSSRKESIRRTSGAIGALPSDVSDDSALFIPLHSLRESGGESEATAPSTSSSPSPSGDESSVLSSPFTSARSSPIRRSLAMERNVWIDMIMPLSVDMEFDQDSSDEEGAGEEEQQQDVWEKEADADVEMAELLSGGASSLQISPEDEVHSQRHPNTLAQSSVEEIEI